jgi:hypothetical protein
MTNQIKEEPDFIQASKVKTHHVDWLWPNRIPLGTLSLLVGIGGVSKSVLSLYMAAQISTGRPWADSSVPQKSGSTVILSAEDDPSITIVPRLKATGANADKIFILRGKKVTLPDGTVGNTFLYNLSKDMDLIHLDNTLKAVPDPRLVIIDPYTAYMGGADSNSNTDVRSFLHPLAALAADHNISIVGITHLNKNQDLAADFRILGSVGQQNAARMVWLVASDPDDFDRRYFVWLKGNLAPHNTGLAYRLVNTTIQTDDGYDSNMPVCAFEKEPVTLTAEELLAPRKKGSSGRPVKQTDAREWLESTLSEGPVDSKSIYEEGEILGYSKRTLERVKSTMGIMSIPIRQEVNGKVIRWDWRLRSSL